MLKNVEPRWGADAGRMVSAVNYTDTGGEQKTKKENGPSTDNGGIENKGKTTWGDKNNKKEVQGHEQRSYTVEKGNRTVSPNRRRPAAGDREPALLASNPKVPQYLHPNSNRKHSHTLKNVVNHRVEELDVTKEEEGTQTHGIRIVKCPVCERRRLRRGKKTAGEDGLGCKKILTVLRTAFTKVVLRKVARIVATVDENDEGTIMGSAQETEETFDN